MARKGLSFDMLCSGAAHLEQFLIARVSGDHEEQIGELAGGSGRIWGSLGGRGRDWAVGGKAEAMRRQEVAGRKAAGGRSSFPCFSRGQGERDSS